MKTVRINASTQYDIFIGKGLLSELGQRTVSLGKAEKVCIVSDSNVWPLYGEAVRSSLLEAGLEVTEFVFPAGEEQKNGSTYLSLLNFLAENRLTRSDLVAALGGGVVGDLAGFAAATYLRGIRLIQLPTTLLAAVDSSVGGKTAIDLSAGKNLAGAFHQPSLVLCDTDCLNSLPVEIFRAGCAEIIKYGILYDRELFSYLAEAGMDFDRHTVIARCAALKGEAVEADEFDTGARMKLNLGHTIGHGVEAASHFAVSHGCAVAIGTAIVSRSACAYGFCTAETRDEILRVLDRFGLPTAEMVAEMVDYANATLRAAGYKPYYLYRQKYMSGSFENVGWSRDGLDSLYNIYMMEEVHTILSLGGGGMNKVNLPGGKLQRFHNPKFPEQYISQLDSVLTQKEEIFKLF